MGSQYADFVLNHDFVFDVSIGAGVPFTPFSTTIGYSYSQGNANGYTAGYVHVGAEYCEWLGGSSATSITLTTEVAGGGVRMDYYILVHPEVNGRAYYNLYQKKDQGGLYMDFDGEIVFSIYDDDDLEVDFETGLQPTRVVEKGRVLGLGMKAPKNMWGYMLNFTNEDEFEEKMSLFVDTFLKEKEYSYVDLGRIE